MGYGARRQHGNENGRPATIHGRGDRCSGLFLWASPCPRPTRIGGRREPVARRRKRVPPRCRPDTYPRRVPAAGYGSARVRSITCSWATSPGRLRVGNVWACRVFGLRLPRGGARLSKRDRGSARVDALPKYRCSPQVMGTPGLISRWGLKTTATVGAVFRGFIPIPRANRIRPFRIWGGYRLYRRSQRVIEWQRAVTRPCAQYSVNECVMAHDSGLVRPPDGQPRHRASTIVRARFQSQPITSSRVIAVSRGTDELARKNRRNPKKSESLHLCRVGHPSGTR